MEQQEFIDAVKAKLAEMLGEREAAEERIASVKDGDDILVSEYKTQTGRGDDPVSWICAIARVADDFANWY